MRHARNSALALCLAALSLAAPSTAARAAAAPPGGLWHDQAPGNSLVPDVERAFPSLAPLVAQIKPGVVNIATTQRIRHPGFYGYGQGPFDQFFQQFFGGQMPQRAASSRGASAPPRSGCPRAAPPRYPPPSRTAAADPARRGACVRGGCVLLSCPRGKDSDAVPPFQAGCPAVASGAGRSSTASPRSPRIPLSSSCSMTSCASSRAATCSSLSR